MLAVISRDSAVNVTMDSGQKYGTYTASLSGALGPDYIHNVE